MKKKNRSIIIKIVVVILLFGFGGYYLYNEHRLAVIEKNKLKISLIDDLSVEVNDLVKISSFVKSIQNGVILNNDDYIDTSKLGNSVGKLIIKNKYDEEEKYEVLVSVIDTVKPEIIANNEINSYIGNSIDLLKDVIVKDNSGEDIKVTVSGEYNINEVGKYKLKYVAIDGAGNMSEYDFVLNITNDPNNYSFTTSKGFSGKVINGVTYIDGTLIANKSYKLPSNYGYGLTTELQNAFSKMKSDANELGYNLWIASGYRSYYDQQYIYNNYVKEDGQMAADTYSARAGHSEHQTGLAVDLNDISDSFGMTDTGKWLSDNCYKYGFILRYPKGKEKITGYIYEPWHFRYVGTTLAEKLYNNGNWITLEEYFGIDSKYS